jgi:uncharacterized membrane protein YkvA (DUF1232 family)
MRTRYARARGIASASHCIDAGPRGLLSLDAPVYGRQTARMEGIAEFVRNGSQRITPADIAQFEDDLPLVLAKVAELDAPALPHLRSQTQFLVRYVEDCLGGQFQPEDIAALAEALFGLMYLLKGTDIIPDDLPGGFADDSAVLRAVLAGHGDEFNRYANHAGLTFSRISLEA